MGTFALYFGLNSILFLIAYVSYIHIHIILGSENKFTDFEFPLLEVYKLQFPNVVHYGKV